MRNQSLDLRIDDPEILSRLDAYASDIEGQKQVAILALKIGLEALAVASGKIDANSLQKVGEGVLIQMQDMLEFMLEDRNKEILKQFSLDHSESAMTRLNKNMSQHYDEVKEALVAVTVRKEEQRRTTGGGLTFEDQIGDLLSEIASQAGDFFEAVGTITGAVARSKKGDFVITLGNECKAAGERIVIEAKRDRSYTLSKILEECKESRKNRKAQVSVFILDKQYGEERGQPILTRHDNDIIILWDADEVDTDIIVHTAFWLARSLITPTDYSTEETEIQRDLIERSLESIQEQLQILDLIVKSSENAQREIAKIRENTINIKTTIEAKLATLFQQAEAIFD